MSWVDESMNYSGTPISKDFTALATWDNPSAAMTADDSSVRSSNSQSKKTQRVLASDLQVCLPPTDAWRYVKEMQQGVQGLDQRSTALLVSIAVTCTPIYSRKPVRMVYRVVAPCGQNWTQPGKRLVYS